MLVTKVDFIYMNSQTSITWKWPLKHLRQYDSKGEVFLFEAGRKCHGGEGLYVFSSKKANKMMKIVSRNINNNNVNQSRLQLPGTTSSHQNTLMYRATRSGYVNVNVDITPESHNHHNKDYVNVDLSAETPPPRPPCPIVYKEVVFTAGGVMNQRKRN